MEKADFSTAAVFDGVGAWNDDGVDPKIWAQSMAHNTMEYMQSEAGIITALDQAYAETLKTSIQGSCTAVVVRHNKGTTTLQYANLGDSGVAIYRNGRIFFETSEQTIGFNYPYQLSSDRAETPQDADRGSIPIKQGDIIVLSL